MIRVELELRLANDQAAMAKAIKKQLSIELKGMPYRIRIMTDVLPKVGAAE